jgi:hypothetical protein
MEVWKEEGMVENKKKYNQGDLCSQSCHIVWESRQAVKLSLDNSHDGDVSIVIHILPAYQC